MFGLSRGSSPTWPLLRGLIDDKGRLVLPPGGLQDMANYHFALVRGGAWRDGDELW